MKKILAFTLFALFAAQALAAVGWVRVDPPSVRWFGKPDFVDLDDVRHWSPTDAQCVEAGWVACEYGGNPADAVLDYSATPPLRDMTQEEMDARAAEQAQAEADAAAQATLPQTFPTGIAVTNAAGHWVKFIPDGTNVVAQTLAIQVSQSPLDPEVAAQMEAEAIAAHGAKKAAKKAKRDSARGKAGKANGVPALREAFAELLDSLED